jgi:hypothetical protein
VVREHGEESLSVDIHDLFNAYGRHGLPYSWPGTGATERSEHGLAARQRGTDAADPESIDLSSLQSLQITVGPD